MMTRKPVEQSEQRLSTIIAQLNAGIAQTDSSGRFIDVNDRYSEILGYSKEEISKLTVADITHPEDWPRNEELFTKAIEEGINFFIEKRYIRKDGSVIWVNNSVSLVTGPNGEKFITAVTIDITKQKEAEEALLYRKTLLEAQNEAVPDAILVVDTKGQMLSFNRHFATLWKIPKKIIDAKDDAAALQFAMTQVADAQSFIDRVNYCYAHPDEATYEEVLFKDGRIIERYGNAVISSTGINYGWVWYFRDITERRKKEEALKESESRFRNLVRDATAAIVVLTGPEMKVEVVNEAYSRLIGLKPEDLLDKPLFSVIPDAEAYYRPIMESVLQSGEPVSLYDSPYTVVTKGKTIEGFVHVVYQPYRTTEGAIIGVMVICQDVTESVNSKKLLQASETKFRSVIAEAPAGIGLFVGRDLVIESPNQAFVDIVGKGWGIVGKPLREAMPELITEGQSYLKILDDVFTTGRIFRTDGSLVKIVQNGVMTHKYYNFTYSPMYDSQEMIWAILHIAIDVTDQVKASQKVQESEERFRVLSDAMPQFVWTGDAEGQLGYFNQAVYDYSGLSKESIETEGWLQIVHPDDREENIRLWRQAITTGQNFIFEHRFKRFDGKYRWQLSRAVPQKNAEGVVQQWIGTSTDIQDKKNIEEQLEKLVTERTMELQRSNGDLQQFAHVASHDLKEPVRKVKIFVNRLEQHLEGKLDETSLQYFERIHSATNRMFTMIDGVLNYSTINAHEQAPQQVDLNEVLKSIETDLETSIQNTGAQVQFGNLPVIEGASVLIYQLFYNLINNSIKFAKASVAPKIKIESEIIITDKKQFAKLILSDNGIGFEEEYAKVIFNSFTRLNSKDKYEGTGLGLALCEKIVLRHGGSITASGTPGKGATFNIILPVEQYNTTI